MSSLAPRLLASSTLALLILCGIPAAHADTSGRELVNKAKVAGQPATEFRKLRMVLVAKSGHKRTRALRFWRKTQPGANPNLLIRFDSPGEIAGTALLTLGRKGADDDQHLYLPALRRPRRIVGSSNQQFFAGTDFTYEDLKNWVLDNYEYGAPSRVDWNGKPCLLVEARPRPKAQSAYRVVKLWIDASKHIVRRTEFVGGKGTVIKVLERRGLRSVGSRYRFLQTLVTNLETGSSTYLHLDNVEIDKPLSDELFTIENLGRSF